MSKSQLNLFLITYDYSSPGQHWDKILVFVREHNHLRLSETTYLFESPLDSVMLLKTIKGLAAKDYFYLVRITEPVLGRGDSEANNWITLMQSTR